MKMMPMNELIQCIVVVIVKEDFVYDKHQLDGEPLPTTFMPWPSGLSEEEDIA